MRTKKKPTPDPKPRNMGGRPRTDPSGEAINDRFEIRVTPSEKARMEETAEQEGFPSLNAWAREMLRRAVR